MGKSSPAPAPSAPPSTVQAPVTGASMLPWMVGPSQQQGAVASAQLGAGAASGLTTQNLGPLLGQIGNFGQEQLPPMNLPAMYANSQGSNPATMGQAPTMPNPFQMGQMPPPAYQAYQPATPAGNQGAPGGAFNPNPMASNGSPMSALLASLMGGAPMANVGFGQTAPNGQPNTPPPPGPQGLPHGGAPTLPPHA